MDTPHAHSMVGIAYFIEYSKPMGVVIRFKFNFINYYSKWLMETKTISNPNRKVKERVGRIYSHTFSQRGSLRFTVHSNAICCKETYRSVT